MNALSRAPLRLLHMDADLYSATAFVLDALKTNIVPGTVIVFDEMLHYPGFEHHELRAFAEFVVDGERAFRVIAVENGSTEPVAVQVTR